MFKKHPKTRFVIAHMDWLGNDLQRLSTWLDDNPNASTEVGAVLYDLGRQPRAAHDFLVNYQDRVLFGKDAFEPNDTRTTGASSRRRTSISTTTATTTHSGSSTGWTCPTRS